MNYKIESAMIAQYPGVSREVWFLDKIEGKSASNICSGTKEYCQQTLNKIMNQITIIHPYKVRGTWVFTDEAVGLVQEPFVSGMPEMIDDLVRFLPDAEKGFKLLFSLSPFPGYHREITWIKEEFGGNWYFDTMSGLSGWLCPALFKYFDKAPAAIYVKAERQT